MEVELARKMVLVYAMLDLIPVLLYCLCDSWKSPFVFLVENEIPTGTSNILSSLTFLVIKIKPAFDVSG